jgi:protein ImuA
MKDQHTLSALRQNLALQVFRPAADFVSFGLAALDGALGGGLARAALHEVYAASTSDLPAATGFAAAWALRALKARPLVWIRLDFLDTETGGLYPSGLAELGLDPGQMVLVRVRDMAGLLKASAEAVRCSALGAVVIEPWGEQNQFDLTTSRRLALSAESSRVLTLLLRVTAKPPPSAATTRWQVRTLPSRPLEANAPGFPAFSANLLRHRYGVALREWMLEWDNERKSFQERSQPAGASLSRPVVPVSADRPSAAGANENGRCRAG